MKLRRLALVLLLTTLVGPVLPALEVEEGYVDVRFQEAPRGSRVILEFNSRPFYQVQKREDRVIVTLQGEFRSIPYKSKNFDDPVLARFKLNRGSRETELAFFTGPEFGTVSSFEMTAPFRLVLEFQRRTATASAPPAAAPAPGAVAPHAVPTTESPRAAVPAAETPPAPVPESPRGAPVPNRPPGIQVIVVDAGHGGSESGARGPTGLQEKDVTLDMARRLQAGLAKRLGVNVILTRDSDRQVSLDDRTAIANRERADLFLSIHVNASQATVARGAETYFLSYQATDDASRALAALENNTIGVENPAGNPSLGMVLWDLAKSQYLAQSSRLAETIQENLNTLLRIESRGVKQAPFKVLMGATMPAVLVEIGFITNSEEERRLKDGAYREQIAQAIIDSVATFKERAEKQLGKQ